MLIEIRSDPLANQKICVKVQRGKPIGAFFEFFVLQNNVSIMATFLFQKCLLIEEPVSGIKNAPIDLLHCIKSAFKIQFKFLPKSEQSNISNPI